MNRRYVSMYSASFDGSCNRHRVYIIPVITLLQRARLKRSIWAYMCTVILEFY